MIALGMSYAPAQDPRALDAYPNRGRISVYAQGGDYHDVVKRNLKALARWLVAEGPALRRRPALRSPAPCRLAVTQRSLAICAEVPSGAR